MKHAKLPCPLLSPSINSKSLLKLMSTEYIIPSNHLTLCHPLLLLPSIFPSIRLFSNELALCIRWPKYWCFNFSISPSNEYSGLISFRNDWLDLLTVQGTLTPQFESINSLTLSLFYGSTLTPVHDYWRNHSFDYMDLCWLQVEIQKGTFTLEECSSFLKSKTLWSNIVLLDIYPMIWKFMSMLKATCKYL